MKNAKKFDDRVTIGGVPDSEDLGQLKELGFKTLIDLRDEDDKFGGLVEKRAVDLGLRYVSIPIDREEIREDDLTQFRQAVSEKQGAPIYAFSRFGKRPLAFLLLFEAEGKDEHLPMIFRKARQFGLNLQGDLLLQDFLVNFYNR